MTHASDNSRQLGVRLGVSDHTIQKQADAAASQPEPATMSILRAAPSKRPGHGAQTITNLGITWGPHVVHPTEQCACRYISHYPGWTRLTSPNARPMFWGPRPMFWGQGVAALLLTPANDTNRQDVILPGRTRPGCPPVRHLP
jgi:hypothetical protein